MSRIRFYVAKETTQYESQGFYYKSADANFADTYSKTGGGYVRKVRWCEVPPDEATHFSWEAPASKPTPMVGDPLYRYQLEQTEEMSTDLRSFFSVIAEGKRSIQYSSLFDQIDSLPLFLKRAILATELEQRRRHQNHKEYLEQYHPAWVVERLQAEGVEPIYFEESVHRPDLRPKLFEKVEADGKVGVKFAIPKGAHGARHPKNLDRLPDSIQVEVGDYNRLVKEVTSVTYWGLITAESAEEFHKLSCNHAHSLSNCGKGALMCSTLELIYETLSRGMYDALNRSQKTRDRGGLSPEEYLATFPDMRKG